MEWTDTKVSFRLHGRRYPGLEFHLVKTNRDWLALLASAQGRLADPLRPAVSSRCWQKAAGRRSTIQGWWFEPKLDGIRRLAELSTGETVLRTRTDRDATASPTPSCTWCTRWSTR